MRNLEISKFDLANTAVTSSPVLFCALPRCFAASCTRWSLCDPLRWLAREQLAAAA